MPTSQNGWPASSDKASIGVNSGFAPCGVTFPGGCKGGDVETVLGYLATQFHLRVEPLVPGWNWGYTYKEISGSSTLSNHASATALDTNAPDHGYGGSGTFTSAQVSAIRAILAEVSPAVRWGGDYSGTKDEMHWEINANSSTVADVARRLGGGGTTPPPSGQAPPYPLPGGCYFGPLYGPNESLSCMVPGVDTQYQPNLRQWQNRMIDRGWEECFLTYGADGMYGETLDVSEAGQCALQFQEEKGLGVDGLIGPQTWSAAWTYPIT